MATESSRPRLLIPREERPILGFEAPLSRWSTEASSKDRLEAIQLAVEGILSEPVQKKSTEEPCIP
jgi:hypothetical protein